MIVFDPTMNPKNHASHFINNVESSPMKFIWFFYFSQLMTDVLILMSLIAS